jgi:peroxiredoxin
MRDFGVPAGLAGVAGVLLPLVELAVAVALVPTSTARWAALVAMLLLLAFIAGIANALRHGRSPDCHCFGQLHSAPAGPSTLARNAVLAALAVVVVVDAPGAALDDWVAARTAAELVAVGAGIAAIVFGAAWLVMWRERGGLKRQLARAQRMATSAAPGIPIGSRAPKFSLPDLRGDMVSLDSLLARGRPLLMVFVSPGCEQCVELLPKLARWQSSLSDRLTLVMMSTGSVKRNRPIFEEEYGMSDVLLQEFMEVSDAFRIRGTPSAVVITPDGIVATNPAETVFGIEPLLRTALNDGVRVQAETPVAQ